MSRTEHRTDRAAEWVLAQEATNWTVQDQAAFEAWLAESDANRTAYLRMRHSWREADRIGALSRTSMGVESPSERRRAWRWYVPAAAAASLLIALGSNLLVYRQQPSVEAQHVKAATFATALGAQKTVGFLDGSKVRLNTASRLRAAITTEKREVWVDEGEAFFEVAHRENRPFVVHVGDRQVTVLGTKFAVRRDGEKITVMVLEGSVRVDELVNGRPVRSSVIVGGDIAFTSGMSILVTKKSGPRVEEALAWREGLISFDHSNLGEIAAEFNRYHARKLVVTDPEIASLRIGGMFPSNDPESFIELLRNAYGLKITETPTEVRIAN
jgi:transmembrane sensor